MLKTRELKHVLPLALAVRLQVGQQDVQDLSVSKAEGMTFPRGSNEIM